MKKTFLFFPALLACFVWYACKNDDSDPAPGNSLSSLQEFYDRYAPVSQFFTVNSQPQTIQTITGAQGTELTISSNMFKKLNGQNAAGSIILELKEVYNKSDMLYAGKPTVTATGPLRSGGEVFLKATLEATGEELILNDSVPIPILFPAVAPFDTMFGFIQGANGAGQFQWEPMVQSGWPTVAFNTNNGYVIESDTLTWINCDQPIYSNPWVKFTMTGNYTQNEYLTDVFLFFPDNIMIHVYGSGPTSFTNNYTPCNSSFTAVAIGFKNGILYSSITPVQVGTTDHNLTFTLSPITESELTEALAELD